MRAIDNVNFYNFSKCSQKTDSILKEYVTLWVEEFFDVAQTILFFLAIHMNDRTPGDLPSG